MNDTSVSLDSTSVTLENTKELSFKFEKLLLFFFSFVLLTFSTLETHLYLCTCKFAKAVAEMAATFFQTCDISTSHMSVSYHHLCFCVIYVMYVIHVYVLIIAAYVLGLSCVHICVSDYSFMFLL